MRASSHRPRRQAVIAVAIVLVLAVLLAACGSSGSSKPSAKPSGNTTNSVTPTSGPKSTALGQGVTDKEVKIGIVLIDYSAIAQFIDFSRGDQQKIFQAFIDYINANGGVAGGKKLVPVYSSYVSIGTAGPEKACTSLTEDAKVFATVGVLYDPSGSGQVCFTKQHHSILITHELSEDIMKKAPPGLLLTVDSLAERSTRTMLDLAKKQGMLDGKKFAILAETNTKSRIDSTIKPELQKLGVAVGTAGTLQTGDNPDTTQAQAQLDSLIERWKGEGDNAVFISGLDTVSKVFVQKIKAAMPDAFLMTDADSSARGAGQDAVAANVNPNPYDGIVSLAGLSDEDQFKSPKIQDCMKVWERASGTKVVGPADLKPDKNGKREEIWVTVRDACDDLNFFKYIADKVGPYLDNENWVNTVNSLGSITELTATPAASLGPGKYDADNYHALVQFDPTAANGKGDWKDVTPLQDDTKQLQNNS